MPGHVVDALVCPHGEPALWPDDRSLVCAAGHRFDRARQGYVNLLVGPAPAAADTVGMVAARAELQAAGHQDTITQALVAAVADARRRGRSARSDPDDPRHRELIVDVGAGTGHHLAAVAENRPDADGLAVDISKHASRRSARVHPRVTAVVADVWRGLPVRDGVADVVLDVFAPRHVAEFRRILATDGALVVVTPTRRHLAPLVEVLGLLRIGDDKLERIDADVEGAFDLVARVEVETVLDLERRHVELVVSMGPNAHHVADADLARRMDQLTDPVEVVSSVTVSTYRRRASRAPG